MANLTMLFSKYLLTLACIAISTIANAQLVTVYGTLANTGGASIPVHMTNGDTLNVTVLTDPLGNYSIVAVAPDTIGWLQVYFVDCNASVIDTVFQTAGNVPPIEFNGDYCALLGTDSCLALFHPEFESAANTYHLTIDSATQENAVSYLWTFGDGSYSLLNYPIHTYNAAGVYDVCMFITEIDSHICQYCVPLTVDSGTHINVVAFTTGIQNYDDEQFEIFPNPASNNIYVKTHGSETLLRCYNSLGMLLGEYLIRDWSALQVSHWPAGSYYIQFISREGNTRKVIIKN